MYESLLNFRPIGGSLYKHSDGVEDPNLLKLSGYRCARPDKISEEDFRLIQSELGIRYVLDLRNYDAEYLDSTGMKVIDNSTDKAELKVVDVMTMEKNNAKDIVWIDGTEESNQLSREKNSKFIHYMITLTGSSYFKQYLKNEAVSLWRRICSLFVVLISSLLGLSYHVYFFHRHGYKDRLLLLYKDIIDGSGLIIRSALEIIRSHGSEPFMICCHAGKDRTGILSALLLSICGYDKTCVVADYTLTSIGLPSTHDELKVYTPNFREAPREVMLRLLEHIDTRYGSVSEYLVSIGITLDKQREIKKNLTGTETSG